MPSQSSLSGRSDNILGSGTFFISLDYHFFFRMRLLILDHSVEYGLALVCALCVLWQYWFRSFKFEVYKIGLDFYLKVNRFKERFKEPINAFRNDNQIFF